jgi:hypothetical protein
MEPQNSKEKPQIERPTHEALITSEWATIKQLEKMLHDTQSSLLKKEQA